MNGLYKLIKMESQYLSRYLLLFIKYQVVLSYLVLIMLIEGRKLNKLLNINPRNLVSF